MVDKWVSTGELEAEDLDSDSIRKRGTFEEPLICL